MADPSTSQYPLDPDLFNPDVVGHQFAAFSGDDQHQSLWSPPALGPSSEAALGPEDFYPGEDDWALDFHDPNDDTEEEYVDDEEQDDDDDDDDDDEDEDGILVEPRKKKQGRPRKSKKRDSSPASSISGDSSDEEDEGADEEGETDLARLIEAIHKTNSDKRDETRGLLSKEWDRSMDQELNELQEAEKSMRSGRRKRHKIRGEPELSTEVSMLVGKANLCFVEKKYEEAIPLFEEVVRIEPMCKMAWNNLGAIYQDLNDFEKACQFRMIGAHLTAKSGHLWKELGAESRQHGLLSQAIYCFSEAIKAEKNDVEALWDRSYLLYEVGRPRQALAGYLGILKLNPFNPDVLREIAHLCATTDEKETPLKLFKSAFEHYRTTIPIPSDEELQVGFGIDHLRILVDLLMASRPDTPNVNSGQENSSMTDEERQHSHYFETMGIIKQATRWIQGRTDPQSPNYLDWDLLDDDREFDPFRRQRDEWEMLADPRYEEQPPYPIDHYFRTCLGICRLKMGDDEEAKMHFDIIKEQSVFEHSDLFILIGDAYSESDMWHEALEFFQELADNDSTNTPSIWHRIGQCYRKSGNLEEASECYEAIVETDYMDLVAKTQLAEIYEITGKQDEACALVDDIIEVRRKARAQGIVIERDPMGGPDGGPGGNQSRANNILAVRNPSSKSITERRMEESIRTERYLNCYQRLEELASQLAKVDDTTSLLLINEFVRIANPMVEGFRSTPALFPCDLTKKFVGVHAPHKRNKKDETRDDEIVEENLRSSTGTEFRGIAFPDWVKIFVYYAFCCAKLRRTDEAAEVLGHVMSAPLFRQSAAMQQALRLAYAAICYAKGDFVGVTDTIRWLGLRLLYHNDPVRLISALLSQGFQQSMAFANSNLQKYLLRQIKLIDDHVARGKAQGEGQAAEGGEDDEVPSTLSRPQIRGRGIHFEQVEDKDQGINLHLEGEEDEDESYWKPTKFIPKKSNPVFIISFAQILAATRSYQSAIVHYLRMYETYPHEPLLNLVLGLSYSQRAMQRQTDNRHHQIVQATAFFDRYRKLRSSRFAEEIEYNLGRFYHGLGLNTLATAHYQRVLSISAKQIDERDEEMSNFPALAAYNLVLIYQTSGSPDLAHDLICEYLSV